MTTRITKDNVDWDRVRDGVGSSTNLESPYTVAGLKQLASSLGLSQSGDKASLLNKLEPYRPSRSRTTRIAATPKRVAIPDRRENPPEAFTFGQEGGIETVTYRGVTVDIMFKNNSDLRRKIREFKDDVNEKYVVKLKELEERKALQNIYKSEEIERSLGTAWRTYNRYRK